MVVVSVSGRVPPSRTANTKGVLALLARFKSLLSEPSSVMNEIENDISFAKEIKELMLFNPFSIARYS